MNSANLKANKALSQEWAQAEAKASMERQPENLRSTMRTLQAAAWKTSAITSQRSLYEWIILHENDDSATLPAAGLLSVGHFSVRPNEAAYRLLFFSAPARSSA